VRLIKKLLRYLVLLALLGSVVGALGLWWVYHTYSAELPDVEVLRQVQLQQPLRIYSADGKLIASIGEARRSPTRYADLPDQLLEAFIAVEDARFFEHPGVDYQGILRAGWEVLRSGGEYGSGGSTITMQLARNFFLSPERRIERKIKEILLAIRIEQALSKEEILELYLNKIFLGHRAYGVAAAAEVYYGKTLADLTLAEAAMIAGLPKAPSDLNPVQNPDRARERRNYVLARMLEVGFITQAAFVEATEAPDFAFVHDPPVELEADYVGEMVRQEAERLLGPEATTAGYRVYTTVVSTLQEAANRSVRSGLEAYDLRHGYRGPEAHFELPEQSDPRAVAERLSGFWSVAGQVPALVLSSDAERAELQLVDGQLAELELEGLLWARPYINESQRGPTPKRVDAVLKRGDVVRVRRADEGGFVLSQIPAAQAALVSIDPEDGAIRALVGGYSFGRSKFNRAVQSARQPGSSFKPFVYSAALDQGFTPASIVNDAPLVYVDPWLDKVWRPQNDNSKFYGPMRLREAMVLSRNLVSIRVLEAVGIDVTRRFIMRFGFSADALPPNLSMALGTASAAPLALARGYAVFANGGFLVDPHLIVRIEDSQGRVVHQGQAPRACRSCPERLALELNAAMASPDPLNSGAQTAALELAATADEDTVETADPAMPRLAVRAIDERNAFLISSMLRDVVKRGTGRAAMALGRDDLAGKTGTTNEYRDAWFSGFNDELVTTAWVGFDGFTSLGRGEFGAKAALPVWMGYMEVALEGMPQHKLVQPPGITTARVSKETGQLTWPGDPVAMLEYFRVEDLDRLGAAARQNASATYEIF
jgi:penicillin-binding protein 1A